MRESGRSKSAAEGASSRLNRVFLRVILLPILLLAVLAGGLIWQISRLLASSRAISRSDIAISRANEVYRLLVDQETGLRGYALTASPDFLEPYRAAEASVRTLLPRLNTFEAEDSQQTRRINQLLAQEAEWHRFASGIIDVTARGGDPRPLIRTRRGKRAMDRMRAILGSLIREEEVRRHQRRQHANEMVPHVFFTGGGLTVLAGILLAFASTRELSGVSRSYEQSLREREESGARLGGIIGSAMDAIISVDAEQRIQVFNTAAERMFGLSRTEALGAALETLLPERYRAVHREQVRAFGAEGVSSRKMGEQMELRALRTGGEEFPIEATISQVEIQGQKLFTAVVRDITEREESERALRESQALFRDFMDHSPALAFIRDAAGRLIYANAPYERFFGASLVNLEGRTLEELVPGETADQLRTVYERVLAENRPHQECFPVPAPDGQKHELQFYLFPITHTDGHSILGGLALDISGQRALESQLRQSQKMEAVGRLAGGVAHDFNNMLTVITGYSELILNRVPPDDPVSSLVGEVKAAGERAASLTRQLLTFSRQQVVEVRLLDLNQVVTGMGGMLQRLIGEDVQLVSIAAPTAAPVMADPGQIEQILLNLAVNARDAMPQGGKLTIEVREVELDASYAREHHGVTPGPHVMLAVSDTGCGMDAATRARIFEPFFTTKGVGHGTGLGLATVFGIVEQHGGSLWVYSEPDQGTAFKVFFPKATSSGVEEAPARSGEVSRGRESVLLLEDDDLVRGLVLVALETCGYRVVAAGSPQEALRLCEDPSQSFDLLLTDVVMPHMSGREVAEQVRCQCPDLKVLFMSGYTDDAVVRHGVLHAEEQFIQKPFALADLTRKLREVLDA